MADRWVCRSCWSSNEERWDKCLRCKVPRGAQATDGLADVGVIRAGSASEIAFRPHEGELVFGFVLDGTARLGDSDLAHYLRCDVVTAREIVNRTLDSREIEPSGDERTVRMDFPRSLLGEAR